MSSYSKVGLQIIYSYNKITECLTSVIRIPDFYMSSKQKPGYAHSLNTNTIFKCIWVTVCFSKDRTTIVSKMFKHSGLVFRSWLEIEPFKYKAVWSWLSYLSTKNTNGHAAGMCWIYGIYLGNATFKQIFSNNHYLIMDAAHSEWSMNIRLK